MSLAGHLVGGYRKAHHNPIAILNGDTARTVLELTAKPGDMVRLSADQTHDPDGHAVETRWWIYERPVRSATQRDAGFPTPSGSL